MHPEDIGLRMFFRNHSMLYIEHGEGVGVGVGKRAYIIIHHIIIRSVAIDVFLYECVCRASHQFALLRHTAYPLV